MKTLTWKDFKRHTPCYDPQERYGEWSGTILDLLKREDIPARDRIWAATREGVLDDKTLRLFACSCVREGWHLLTDERSRNAVEVAERYANGEATDQELLAAWEATDQELLAAWEAAREAAWAAANAAASEAAWEAASEAAWEAAWEAANEKQVEILIRLIATA